MTIFVYNNEDEFVSFTREELLELNQLVTEIIYYKEKYWILYEKRNLVNNNLDESNKVSQTTN